MGNENNIYEAFEDLILEQSQRAVATLNKENLKDQVNSATSIIGLDIVLNTISFTNSVTENITRDKIFRFLSRVNPHTDNQIIARINASRKYRNTVGRTLLELIDRMDSEVKPEILGNLCTALQNEEITYPELLKAGHILNLIFFIDLLHLRDAYDGEYVIAPVDGSLTIHGLVKSNADFAAALNAKLAFDENGSKEPEDYVQEKDSLTRIGKILVNIGLKDIG